MKSIKFTTDDRTLKIVSIGSIYLKSGKLVACDPYFAAGATPFVRRVAHGYYVVRVFIRNFGELGARVTAAQLVFRDSVGTSYEDGVNQYGLCDYVVESGLSCFMDEFSRLAFTEELEKYFAKRNNTEEMDPLMDRMFSGNILNNRKNWLIYNISGSGLNMAIFASGFGDGNYSSYWELDDTGEPVSIITEFCS